MNAIRKQKPPSESVSFLNANFCFMVLICILHFNFYMLISEFLWVKQKSLRDFSMGRESHEKNN